MPEIAHPSKEATRPVLCHPKLPLQCYAIETLSQLCCIRQYCFLRSPEVEVPEQDYAHFTLSSLSQRHTGGTAPITSCTCQRCCQRNDVLQAEVSGTAKQQTFLPVFLPGYSCMQFESAFAISVLFLVAWCTYGGCVCNGMIRFRYSTQSFELFIHISWCNHKLVNDSAMLAFNCAALSSCL